MGNGIIVGRDGFVEIRLEVFDLGLKHNVMGLAVLLLQFIQLPLFFLILISYVLERVLDAEKLALFLLKLASVVVHLALQGLELGFGGVDGGESFVDGVVGLEAGVHWNWS